MFKSEKSSSESMFRRSFHINTPKYTNLTFLLPLIDGDIVTNNQTFKLNGCASWRYFIPYAAVRQNKHVNPQLLQLRECCGLLRIKCLHV